MKCSADGRNSPGPRPWYAKCFIGRFGQRACSQQKTEDQHSSQRNQRSIIEYYVRGLKKEEHE